MAAKKLYTIYYSVTRKSNEIYLGKFAVRNACVWWWGGVVGGWGLGGGDCEHVVKTIWIRATNKLRSYCSMERHRGETDHVWTFLL